MNREPRFEIVRTDAGWHARFRAANGRITFWTENYTRRRAAVAAVLGITGQSALYLSSFQAHPEVRTPWSGHGLTEVRDIDGRSL